MPKNISVIQMTKLKSKKRSIIGRKKKRTIYNMEIKRKIRENENEHLRITRKMKDRESKRSARRMETLQETKPRGVFRRVDVRLFGEY